MFAALIFAAPLGLAQAPPAASGAPIPDLATLLKQVQEHQRTLDKVRENYTYNETIKTDDLDSSGRVKKTELGLYEVFFVNGHKIYQLAQKDGKDLLEGEQKKEQDRVRKEMEKAEATPPGQNFNISDEASVSHILAIMKLSNPRRVPVNGRATIAFDFVGDPHAQTHGMIEAASKKLAGTIWIDEADREVQRLEAHLDDNFHVAGGLVATVHKGSSFAFEQSLVNKELWLPLSAEMHTSARAPLLLKSKRQNVSIHDGEYQRFHTDAVQAGATVHPPAH
jgi:hypothetical protein